MRHALVARNALEIDGLVILPALPDSRHTDQARSRVAAQANFEKNPD